MEIKVQHYNPIIEVNIDPCNIIEINDCEMITQYQNLKGENTITHLKVKGFKMYCENFIPENESNLFNIIILAEHPNGSLTTYKTYKTIAEEKVKG